MNILKLAPLALVFAGSMSLATESVYEYHTNPSSTTYEKFMNEHKSFLFPTGFDFTRHTVQIVGETELNYDFLTVSIETPNGTHQIYNASGTVDLTHNLTPYANESLAALDIKFTSDRGVEKSGVSVKIVPIAGKSVYSINYVGSQLCDYRNNYAQCSIPFSSENELLDLKIHTNIDAFEHCKAFIPHPTLDQKIRFSSKQSDNSYRAIGAEILTNTVPGMPIDLSCISSGSINLIELIYSKK